MARVRFRSPALSFGGASNYIVIPHHAAYNATTLTIEAWYKPTAQSQQSAIFEKSVGDIVNTQYLLFQESTNYTFRLIGLTPQQITAGVAAADVGTWVHLAGAYDGTNLRLYKNGVLVAGPTTVTGSLATGTGRSSIAALFPSSPGGDPSQYFCNGFIDEVRIWNVARTQTQIQENMYRRLSGTESGLIGYWKFDENAGNQAKDATTNANHGTITGAVWAEREVIPELSYSLKIDWDNDGVYSDVTADVLDLTAERGRSEAFGSVVAGSMKAVLDNRAKTYSFDALTQISRNIRPYRAFTLDLLAGGSVFPFMGGKILKLIVNETPADETPTVTLDGQDLFGDMDAEARIDTLVNTTTKALAEKVFDVIGIPAAKRLISITGDPIGFAFGENRSARDWLEFIALSGYRQFVDRQGRYVLLDRLSTINWTGNKIESVRDLGIETNDEGLTTRARVLISPYKQHASDHIVWTSGETPFTLAGREERTLLISFRDPDSGATTGAISLVTLATTANRTGTLTAGLATVTGLAYTSDLRTDQTVTGTGIPANTTISIIDSATQITLSANATASGAQSLTFSPMDYAATNTDDTGDLTASLAVTLIGNPGVSAQLKLANTSTADLKITTLQVRGKLAVPKNTLYLEQEITSDYPDSFRSLESDLIQDSATAQVILTFLLQRYGKPVRRYHAAWSDTETWSPVPLESDINDVILVSLPGTRLEWAMTALRGMSLRLHAPLQLEIDLDLEFLSLAAGPSVGVFKDAWNHQL